jgi:hypothetical protein
MYRIKLGIFFAYRREKRNIWTEYSLRNREEKYEDDWSQMVEQK